jgi:hypothetical protein
MKERNGRNFVFVKKQWQFQVLTVDYGIDKQCVGKDRSNIGPAEHFVMI